MSESDDQSPCAAGFEQSLAELERLVEEMERGELSLEDSLQRFERGVGLTRACQKALRDAELKVRILLQKDAENGSEPFQNGD